MDARSSDVGPGAAWRAGNAKALADFGKSVLEIM
jgi:hypothetical protein